MFYKLGVEQPEYVPDLVAETTQHASEHAQKIGTKSWKYLLISHEQVTEDKRMADFLLSEVKPK